MVPVRRQPLLGSLVDDDDVVPMALADEPDVWVHHDEALEKQAKTGWVAHEVTCCYRLHTYR